VKFSVEKFLRDLNEEWKELEQEHSSDLLQQIKDVMYEGHALLIKPEEFETAVDNYLEWILDSEEVYAAMHREKKPNESEFPLPCYQMFETIIFTTHALFAKELSKDQEQHMRSIFIKHGKNNSMSLEDMLNNFLNSTYETGEICISLDLQMFCEKLLPKLDAKIKQLEA
jgi:hypothetical protein